MGVFLNILTVPGASKEDLFSLLSAVDPATSTRWNLKVTECQLWQTDKGAAASLNDFCSGYEEMTARLSLIRNGPLMLGYIYDDDAWGYYFYDAGLEVDSFCSVPDLLEEISDAERNRLRGRSAALAPYFSVLPENLDPFLTFWEEDEGDAWEIADFLAELGFALPTEEEDLPDRSPDYEQLVSLAEHNNPDCWDEDSLIAFCRIIDLYQTEHLLGEPGNKNLIRRSEEDLRMLGCFIQQFPLPAVLYRLIWQTLELKDAKYGRAGVLYGTLRKQLLTLCPALSSLANPPYDALRVELIRALNGHKESKQTLDVLFARPDFHAAFWDDIFVLKNFVQKDPYLNPDRSPLFLERMCVFFHQNPTAPFVSILLPRFECTLKDLRSKQRKQEETLAAVPSKVPGLSSIPFFLYWLNTFCNMMDLPNLQEKLYEQAHFELNWGRKFVGIAAKTGLPRCKKVVFTRNKQRFQICFHLRYVEYLWGKKLLTQPCFLIEELLELKDADRFFYLLPLLAPVEDPEPLTREIEFRLAQAAPFLSETECQTLACQMAEPFIASLKPEDPAELLLDWIWDKAELDPNIDLETNCPTGFEVFFEQPSSIEQLLCGISDFCNQNPSEFTCWLSGTLQDWLDIQKAQAAMSAEEKQIAFLRSLPQKVFWETSEKLFLYCCTEYQNRLHPNIFVQNPNTVGFTPVGSVQEFLEQSAYNKPASDTLRAQLLNQALGFATELQHTSYVSDLVYLPQKVYLDPDYSYEVPAEIASLPRLLCYDEITPKGLDKLLMLYRKGALLRLELCWDGSASVAMPDSVYVSGGLPISLVLERDGDKWACFCFDDAGHDANQLISDPKGYLTSDSASIEPIPFALGSVPAHSIFYKPEALLEKLPILFRSITCPRPNLQCNGVWSMVASTVYYNREKYTLDKRILGGFPPERAHNLLTDRFYLKEYPTALDAISKDGQLQQLTISGGNRDMPRFYLGRFFQNGLTRLIFHFGPQLHLAFLQDGSNSRMVLLDDSVRTAYFAVSDHTLAPANPSANPDSLSFLGHPASSGLVFSQLLTLRSSADLLFACWKKRDSLLSDSRQFCTEDPCYPCSYDTLRSDLLSLG